MPEPTSQASSLQVLSLGLLAGESDGLVHIHGKALLPGSLGRFLREMRASLCNRVIVMYAGRIVEEGPTRAIFKNPQHPYTWSLLRSMPRMDEVGHERLVSIRGLPPDLSKMPPGCKFHPRCRFRIDKCLTEEPPLAEVDPGQDARCWVLMKNIPNPEAEALK